MSKRHTMLQEMTDRLYKNEAKVGLKINCEKNKRNNVAWSPTSNTLLTVEGNQIECIEASTCQGSNLSNNDNIDSDVDTVFCRLDQTWKRRSISKSSVFVIMTALYASET